MLYWCDYVSHYAAGTKRGIALACTPCTFWARPIASPFFKDCQALRCGCADVTWHVWTGCNCLHRGRRDLLKVQRAFCFPSFELTKPRGANIWRWSWEKQSIATAIAEFSAASWSSKRFKLRRFTFVHVDVKDLKGSGWLSKTVMIRAKRDRLSILNINA